MVELLIKSTNTLIVVMEVVFELKTKEERETQKSMLPVFSNSRYLASF